MPGGDDAPGSDDALDPDRGLDTAAVRAHLLDERRALIATVADCADAVAAGWDGESTTDPDLVTGPLRATLERAGVLGEFPTVLRECVTAAGGRLRAEPVPAPPYVVVTSVGPVLRATLEDGRLVVTLRTFAVERPEEGGPARYVRTGLDEAGMVDVAVRGR
ncbi:hypothetical protein [Haloglomus litoreum]|uniref:hypothetical protein n=1 Tax=Haloglomus litoreum TaxID=3034026 RepID=UPI0023E7AF7E|nr:hypothetical protein [Haloglomus sp. DT116]